MQGLRRTGLAALAAGLALAAAACGSEEDAATSAAAEAVESATAAAGGETGGETAAAKEPAKVTLQLKWVTQAQFAGYYAAEAQGYYDDEALDVTLKVGGPDITPEQVVASGQAEFGINWLPSLLATRDKGGDLVNIAQVFAKSGMTEVTHKDSGITDIAGLRGKKVGVWCCGNENELLAALVKNGMDPQKDVEIVNQPFDMSLFLNRTVDAAAAMTYNELAQVLETENPKTGELYTLDDLNVITMEDAGTAMLEDGIFARGDWLQDEGNKDVATRFVKASLKGWVYCRDNPDECVKTVLENGPTLGEGHQRWMMNEINALTWPAASGGIGVMDEEAYKRTADIAQQFKVITKAPDEEAYTTEFAEAAVQQLKDEGVDVQGAGYTKPTVEVTAGGK
jgi:NitT/TauT family transport system substrate-binding protein